MKIKSKPITFDPQKGIDDYAELSKQVQDEFWRIIKR